jgi:putative endonuclease
MAIQPLGRRGEQVATAHLQRRGYEIIERNWHCSRGEIDIVATDDETWVFVEVRSRSTRLTENALASITPRKRTRMVASAQLYLSEHNLDGVTWRIDVIAVAFQRNGQFTLDHVENALDW